jgi:hypothetical protein
MTYNATSSSFPPLNFRGYDKMYDEQSDGLAERRANPLQVGVALIDCGLSVSPPS